MFAFIFHDLFLSFKFVFRALIHTHTHTHALTSTSSPTPILSPTLTLTLTPTPTPTLTTFRYKRDVTGPSWHLDKTPRPGGQDGVEKEIKEEKDGKIYTSYDVKTGGEIDWNKEVKGNVPWAKNGARQTQASMLMKDYLLADRLLVKESLDLDPQHTGQSKYVHYV